MYGKRFKFITRGTCIWQKVLRTFYLFLSHKSVLVVKGFIYQVKIICTLPCGADKGLYSFPSNPIVCKRLVTVEAGICSYWEVKSNPECLYPLCTV